MNIAFPLPMNIAFPIIDPVSHPEPYQDTYCIHGLHYDVVITIGDFAIDDMMAEVTIALTSIGLLDPPLV